MGSVGHLFYARCYCAASAPRPRRSTVCGSGGPQSGRRLPCAASNLLCAGFPHNRGSFGADCALAPPDWTSADRTPRKPGLGDLSSAPWTRQILHPGIRVRETPGTVRSRSRSIRTLEQVPRLCPLRQTRLAHCPESCAPKEMRTAAGCAHNNSQLVCSRGGAPSRSGAQGVRRPGGPMADQAPAFAAKHALEVKAGSGVTVFRRAYSVPDSSASAIRWRSHARRQAPELRAACLWKVARC